MEQYLDSIHKRLESTFSDCLLGKYPKQIFDLANSFRCVLGEQIGGPCSDIYRNYLKRKAGGEDPAPERRLVLSHPGFLLSMVGIVVFFVTLADAEPLHWNIKPTVGVAIAGFGSQIVTTVLITCEYSIPCDTKVDIFRLFGLLSSKQVVCYWSSDQSDQMYMGFRKSFITSLIKANIFRLDHSGTLICLPHVDFEVQQDC